MTQIERVAEEDVKKALHIYGGVMDSIGGKILAELLELRKIQDAPDSMLKELVAPYTLVDEIGMPTHEAYMARLQKAVGVIKFLQAKLTAACGADDEEVEKAAQAAYGCFGEFGRTLRASEHINRLSDIAIRRGELLRKTKAACKCNCHVQPSSKEAMGLEEHEHCGLCQQELLKEKEELADEEQVIANVPISPDARDWRDLQTDETRHVTETLSKAFEHADAYRYNNASIRVRVIDPGFNGMTHQQRVSRIDTVLATLPLETQGHIMMLWLYTPYELFTDLAVKSRDREFTHPEPSAL